MILEDVRQATLRELQKFCSYDDYTRNHPDLKRVENLFDRVKNSFPMMKVDNGSWKHNSNNNQMRLLEKLFLEIINQLYNQGIIIWGRDLDSQTYFYPYFSITSYGKKILESDDLIPNDPTGYFTHFRKKVPNADTIVLSYLEESILTFLNNNFFASAVMLGAASEAAFDILLESFLSCRQSNDHSKNDKIRNTLSIKKRFDFLKDEIEKDKKNLPENISKSLDTNFDGIFNIIRLQRNDIGHPTGKPVEINRDLMFAHLQLFVPYCKTIYELMDFYKNNN